MNPHDILLWPDGFWCFREELDQNFLRDDNYRVILRYSNEWVKVQRPKPIPTPTN